VLKVGHQRDYFGW